MIIALSGTPGTGKSSVSRELKSKGWLLIEFGKAVEKEKLYSSYDRSRKCYVVDMVKMTRFFKNIVKQNPDKNIVVDSHLSHQLPSDILDIVVVLRCNPLELGKRLGNRRWRKRKIIENVEAEYIGTIVYDAHEKHKIVYEVDTTRKTVLQSLRIVEKVVRGTGKMFRKKIDWIKNGVKPEWL